MSGIGRDLGMEALDKYLQVKAVVTPIYNSPWLWIILYELGISNKREVD